MRAGAIATLALTLIGAPQPPAAQTEAPPAAVDAVPARPSVEARLARIRQRIQAALVYPPEARTRGLEGETWLRFQIGADGRPLEVSVLRSSGHALLDAAALRATEAAAPLPWVYGTLEVPVHFELSRRR